MGLSLAELDGLVEGLGVPSVEGAVDGVDVVGAIEGTAEGSSDGAGLDVGGLETVGATVPDFLSLDASLSFLSFATRSS